MGEGHQEHHRGPGTMCLQHCSWGQLLRGKILLQEKERTPGYISRDHISESPASQTPKSFVSLLLHSTQMATSKPSTAPVAPEPSGTRTQRHQNPACFVRNGGGAGARNPERVLSNLMLIKEAWKAARSRWLGTHDQMSTHFLETNIYK